MGHTLGLCVNRKTAGPMEVWSIVLLREIELGESLGGLPLLPIIQKS